ncbi:MAG TPA: hypothetical protein VFC79_13005 [Tissierellaceae bacterium]|nr:hypothetical protein [Tissierellaceae bacterium]
MNEDQDKWEERAKKVEEAGQKMQAWGCLLTVLITVPVILTIFFGPIGLGIGALIAVLFLIGRKKK